MTKRGGDSSSSSSSSQQRYGNGKRRADDISAAAGTPITNQQRLEQAKVVLKKCKDVIITKEKEMEDKQQEIKDKQQEIEGKQQEIEDAAAAKAAATSMEKFREADAEKDALVAEKDALVAKKDVLVAEKEALFVQLRDLEAKERELDRAVDEIKKDPLWFHGTAEQALKACMLPDVALQSTSSQSRTKIDLLFFEPLKVSMLSVDVFLAKCMEMENAKEKLGAIVGKVVDVEKVEDAMQNAARTIENSVVRAVETVFSVLITFLRQVGVPALKFRHNDQGIDLIVHEEFTNQNGTVVGQDPWLKCEVKLPAHPERALELHANYCELDTKTRRCDCGVDWNAAKKDGKSECKSERGKACSVIRQTYTYMCSKGDLVALHSSYKHWTVFVRDCEGNLCITPLIAYDDPKLLLVLAVALFASRKNVLPRELFTEHGLVVPTDKDKSAMSKKKQSGAHANAAPRDPRPLYKVCGAAKGPNGVPPGNLTLPLYLDLDVVEELQAGRTGETKRVSLPRRGGGAVDAVIKIADLIKKPMLEHELEQEARVYERLGDLQGKVVPAMIAHGHLEDGYLFGLATEYAGKTLGLDAMSDAFKERAVEALRAIHAKGVLHGDIKRDSLVVSATGDPLFIDFANGEVLPDGASADDTSAFATRQHREMIMLQSCLKADQWV